MKFLLFLYGIFFALPLTSLNILPGGIKIDDIILFCLIPTLPIVVYQKDKCLKISLGYVLFLFLTLIFSFVSFYKGAAATDLYMGDSPYTVISRVIQTVLIVTLLMFIKGASITLKPFFKGYVLSASLSLLIFFSYYFSKVDLASFSSRGVYFAKDIFQYNDDLPFTVHVNTLGSFFLIAFFIIKSNYKRFDIFSYLFLIPSFLLISKGDILAILVYFAYVFYKKNNLTSLLVILTSFFLVMVSPLLYDMYMGLAQYRVYTSGRDELYEGAISSILNNPMGYGLGMQNNVLWQVTGIDFPAHNIFLSIGLEWGMVYLVCSLIFLTLGVYASNPKNRIIFLSFLIIGLFGNAMYFYKFHSLALALSLFGLWYIPKTKMKMVE